jgi:phosphohistidine phosphatase
MRRLMLLRHAKTESDAPSGDDIDRRLDERGRGDAAAIGRWLAQHRFRIDCVLVSTAVRAQQTWDIVGPLLGDLATSAKVSHLAELYLADPADILRTIRRATTKDVRHLLLIGHNPGLHELALGLAADGDKAGRKALAGNLPTSGFAMIDFAVEDWHDISFQRGRLELFVSPKLLKQTSRDN